MAMSRRQKSILAGGCGTILVALAIGFAMTFGSSTSQGLLDEKADQIEPGPPPVANAIPVDLEPDNNANSETVFLGHHPMWGRPVPSSSHPEPVLPSTLDEIGPIVPVAVTENAPEIEQLNGSWTDDAKHFADSLSENIQTGDIGADPALEDQDSLDIGSLIEHREVPKKTSDPEPFFSAVDEAQFADVEAQLKRGVTVVVTDGLPTDASNAPGNVPNLGRSLNVPGNLGTKGPLN